MKFSTFLKLKVALPIIVILSVCVSITLTPLFESTFLRALTQIPGIGGICFLFWFYASYGYCPSCGNHMGKNIGKTCKHCGHVYAKDDDVKMPKKK